METIFSDFIHGAAGPLPKRAQTHLSKVFQNLSVTTTVAALAYNYVTFVPELVATVASLAALAYVLMASSRQNRLYALYFIGAMAGVEARFNVRHLGLRNSQDLSLAVTSFYLTTAGVIATFFVSLRSTRLVLTWATGVAAASGMYLMSTMFLPVAFPMESLVASLAVVTYLVADAAIIVQRTKTAVDRNQDHLLDDVSDTLTVFTDAVRVFYTVLVFLMEQKDKRRSRDDNDDRGSRRRRGYGSRSAPYARASHRAY